MIITFFCWFVSIVENKYITLNKSYLLEVPSITLLNLKEQSIHRKCTNATIGSSATELRTVVLHFPLPSGQESMAASLPSRRSSSIQQLAHMSHHLEETCQFLPRERLAVLIAPCMCSPASMVFSFHSLCLKSPDMAQHISIPPICDSRIMALQRCPHPCPWIL